MAVQNDFATMGIRQIQAGLANKEFSARELAEASLARIAAVDADVHAFLEVTDELALDLVGKFL